MAKQNRPVQIAAQESLVEQLFPLNGLNVASTYDSQPSGTTPVGLNVRTFEALTRRGRGGTRPGLSRYINAQVSGANKIQHLTYIVDPQAEALPGNNVGPVGQSTAPNRNSFGGVGGFAPVRYPVEPGRTYPTPPGSQLRCTFQITQSDGGFGPPIPTLNVSVVAKLNGTTFYSGSLLANFPAPNSVTFDTGALTLRPVGTNVLATTFTWTNADILFNTYQAQFIFWAYVLPLQSQGIENQMLPGTTGGTQVVTGNL
jgi:hypothetical protein